MSSNHTLWRAGLAGIGALILLKESLDLSRFVLLLPLLCMVFVAHWLNQMLTLYRSGDAMAGCEARINKFAGETLLDHELILARARRALLLERRSLILGGAFLSTAAYWFSLWQVQPFASEVQALLLWRVGLGAAAIVNIVAGVNLRRLLTYSWPSLQLSVLAASVSPTVRSNPTANMDAAR